jgi:hypothetical protein
MKNFKLRASKGGIFGKSYKFQKTAETYAKEWLIEQLYDKKKRIDSKYLERGKESEHLAIQRAANYFNFPLVKNVEQLENEYFTGEFDTKTDDTVIDVKCSWDIFSFPMFEEEINHDYYCQLQIYMNLLGLKKAALVYCLENGTEDMIDRLSWKIAKEDGAEEPDIEHWEKAKQELNYDHIADEKRIKVYKFDYDEKVIEKLQIGVEEVRKYLQTINK